MDFNLIRLFDYDSLNNVEIVRGHDEVPPPDKVRLSGAARKRLRRLMAANVGVDEARTLCLKPWSEIPRDKLTPVDSSKAVKRTWSEDYPNEQLNNASKTSLEGRFKPPFREIAGASRVGIRNVSPMSEEQMYLVRQAINYAIIMMCESGAGPRFLGISHKSGWLLITCENQESQQWIVRAIPKLLPWPEAELSVIPEGDLPKPTVGIAFLPGGEVTSVEDALQLIRVQNAGLHTEYWRILASKEDGAGYTVTLVLDEPSVETLKEMDYRAAFGFKKALFRIKGSSEATPQAVASTGAVMAQPTKPSGELNDPVAFASRSGVHQRLLATRPPYPPRQFNGYQGQKKQPGRPQPSGGRPRPPQGRAQPGRSAAF